jgi:hypothetical protein
MTRSPVETVLHAYLSNQPEEKRARLMQFLPDLEKERLQTLAPALGEASLEIETPAHLLDSVHWSWYLPTLKSYAGDEQALFLAALPKDDREALSLELPCKSSTEELTFLGRSYLRQVLLDSLVGPHDRIVPKQILPPSPLNALLGLSKGKLISLIDLLSMHDFAQEIRQIVETKILKKLYSSLSEEERKFLKQITMRREPFTLPKIGLDRWDGTKEELKTILHRRGLSRLGIALSGQDPALIWYICHQLDIGRGTALFKLSLRETHTTVMVDSAVKQVEELLGYS